MKYIVVIHDWETQRFKFTTFEAPNEESVRLAMCRSEPFKTVKHIWSIEEAREKLTEWFNNHKPFEVEFSDWSEKVVWVKPKQQSK